MTIEVRYGTVRPMAFEPLTREEVLKWPSLGPMGLDPRRVLALITERDLLLEQNPAVRLDGYRELGAKCAALEDELDAFKGRERQLFKIHDANGTECWFEQSSGPACARDDHHRPPTYEDWMRPQREVMRLKNELTLANASAAAAGGVMLDVQQDCIKAVKQVAVLTAALKDAMWVVDRFGDTLNDMDVAGEDEKFDEINERMDRARAALGEAGEAVAATSSVRQEFLEEFLAELCEHVGTVIEPEFVTKIRNLLSPLAWDPNRDQQQRCVCGHTYERHFDSYEDMAPVGCKYCGSDCEMFRPAVIPCPRCDDDARGVLLSPNVWTACPACKRGGP